MIELQEVFSMVMSKQMLEEYKHMKTTTLDEQVLFLCKNNKYKGIVDLNTIYQQFKTAVVLKNSDAIELFENILLQWIDMDDVETLKLCADLGSAALAKEENSGE